jgi:hypothetical protein
MMGKQWGETRPGGKGGGEQTPPGEDLMEIVKGGVEWGEDPMETVLEFPTPTLPVSIAAESW